MEGATIEIKLFINSIFKSHILNRNITCKNLNIQRRDHQNKTIKIVHSTNTNIFKYSDKTLQCLMFKTFKLC